MKDSAFAAFPGGVTGQQPGPEARASDRPLCQLAVAVSDLSSGFPGFFHSARSFISLGRK